MRIFHYNLVEMRDIMFNTLTIIKEGHETLRKVAEEVKFPMSDEDKKTITDMMNHIIKSQIPEIAEAEGIQPGVGLAAPQINVPKRMFVMLTHDFDDRLHKYAFINPEIIYKSDEMIYLPDGEGCLSVPRETEGIVPRHKIIKVKTKLYDTDSGTLRSVTMQLKGYIAIVFQHEFDHLNGVLFVDRLTTEIPVGAIDVFEE